MRACAGSGLLGTDSRHWYARVAATVGVAARAFRILPPNMPLLTVVHTEYVPDGLCASKAAVAGAIWAHAVGFAVGAGF